MTLDVMGPLEETPSGNTYALTVVDHFTKYLAAVPMKQANTESIVRGLMQQAIYPLGVPEALLTDCGTPV
jgi:hypothetical protein